MRKVWLIILSAVLSVSFMGCSSPDKPVPEEKQGTDNGYEKLDLKLSVATGEQGIDYITAKYFADEVKKASDGKVNITIFANSQLTGGDMSKTLDMLLAGGSYELATASGAVLCNIDEHFLVHTLPFIFDSYEQAGEYLDGSGGEYYKKLMAQKGITWLGGFHNGIKQITNGKKEIHAPADMKGMKIRIPSGEVSMKTYQALGADPISMNWGEVYTALQQGTIDGHDNGYMTIDSASIQEVNPYILECNYQYECYTLIANAGEYAKWNEATQKLITEKADEAVHYGRQYLVDKEKEIKKKFLENGVKITEQTPEERQLFVDTTADVRTYFIEKYGQEACDAWGIK